MLTKRVYKAAFTPAQHVARQQVARTSNMLRQQATCCLLRATYCFKQHVARNKQQVARNMLPHNMLRWCKRGLS